MTDLTPDQTQTELIERGGLVIASLVAHSWGGEAAIAVGDLIAEIQRLDEVVERLGNKTQLSDHSPANPKLLSQLDRAIEYQTRIQYARDNRYPK